MEKMKWREEVWRIEKRSEVENKGEMGKKWILEISMIPASTTIF